MMAELGIENFYKTKWGALGSEIVNPVGCADCHDPVTMNLTITRPALIEAFQRQGKDVKNVSIQEMRSLVCAQCHVEYYFKGDGKYLTFPWDNGFTVEAMEQYYDSIQFSDWMHGLSKAPMIKAQHPDYEVFMFGPHAQRGLSCADCHMPYKADGGIKFSDHQVVSPLKNIAATCQTCHKESEGQLRQFVYEYQDKAIEIRNRIEQELSKAHIMAKTAWENGATEAEMKSGLQLIRQAQWRWDFSVASHGGSFHAPVENQRILAHSLDKTMQAQLELQKVLYVHGVEEVNLPDISTKEKAQKYVGLDIPKEKAVKDEWFKTVVPKWLEKAKANKRLISQNS
jgi:nitrite reductase (cytochrome c-552)